MSATTSIWSSWHLAEERANLFEQKAEDHIQLAEAVPAKRMLHLVLAITDANRAEAYRHLARRELLPAYRGPEAMGL